MKHAEIIAKMTVEEKAAILSGVSEWESREIKRLGIPAAFFSDGPHGAVSYTHLTLPTIA